MHTGVAPFLLIIIGGALSSCSRPEPAAPASDSTNRRDRDVAGEQAELDRRHLELQNQVLSDLQKLREGLGTSTAAPEQTGRDAPKLLIFGGASHEVYLGCLCEGRNPESVFNLAGEFGSDLSTTSLRNKFAPYGSNHEDTSACNANAKHPPSVVASDGKSLGLLTLNASLKKRIAAPSVADWLARMCRL